VPDKRFIARLGTLQAFCSELLNLSGGNNHPRRFGAFIVGTVQNNGFVLQSEHCFAN
jgi:hypothetical protein